jgi:hypothetical protein
MQFIFSNLFFTQQILKCFKSEMVKLTGRGNMDDEELNNHRLALKLLEEGLNFAKAHVEEVVDEEDDE